MDRLKRVCQNADDKMINYILATYFREEGKTYYSKAQREEFNWVQEKSVKARESANKTRGHKEKRFVEAIDLLPTFLDAVGSKESKHRLEGNSLIPIINSSKINYWRDAVFSEIDYSFNEARKMLKLGASDARGYMIRTDKWKYIYFKGFPPQLFDLANDPEEFNDLGQSNDYFRVRNEMKELLLRRLISRKNRVAASDEFVLKDRDYTKEDDIMIGIW